MVGCLLCPAGFDLITAEPPPHNITWVSLSKARPRPLRFFGSNSLEELARRVGHVITFLALLTP